jgi:DNA repair exonuclease SbcCD ATPase subunit
VVVNIGTIGNGKFSFTKSCFVGIIGARKGAPVSTQRSNTAETQDFFTSQSPAQHKEVVDLEGLDHVFKWASETVSEGEEDKRVRQARDNRMRKQVLEIIEDYKEQKIVSKSQDEVAYLQRRVIALLTKLQELTEENSTIKQVMVSQFWAVQKIPHLEAQVKVLQAVEYEKEAAVKERRYLMDALAKLKVERDYLEDILETVENENTRLSEILRETRAEVTTLKARKWWHFFLPKTK